MTTPLLVAAGIYQPDGSAIAHVGQTAVLDVQIEAPDQVSGPIQVVDLDGRFFVQRVFARNGTLLAEVEPTRPDDQTVRFTLLVSAGLVNPAKAADLTHAIVERLAGDEKDEILRRPFSVRALRAGSPGALLSVGPAERVVVRYVGETGLSAAQQIKDAGLIDTATGDALAAYLREPSETAGAAAAEIVDEWTGLAPSAAAILANAQAAAISAGAAAADRVLTTADRAATGADRVQTTADRAQTGLDRAQTTADRAVTTADRVQTTADRVQTGLDRVQTTADRVQTGVDRVATAADRVQTGLDRAAAAASAATAVGAVRYLVPLNTPTGTANDLVSSPVTGTPIVGGAANQLVLLPIALTNTGPVTLAVPDIGGGVPRAIRAVSGLGLEAKALVGGRFALLKYMPALERYLMLYPAVNTNGELAVLFRTGASTANALDTVTSDGDLGNYRIRDLFLLPMSVANTSPNVTLNVDGLGAKEVRTSTGDLLPVPAWGGAGAVVALRYRSDTDRFQIAFTNYSVSPDDALNPAKTPSYHVMTTAVSDAGDPKLLLVTPLTPLPNNTMANTRLEVVFPDDRPPEVGMQIKVIGLSAAYFSLRDFDAVSQVAESRWSAKDIGTIARDPITGLFYLTRVDRRVPAVAVEPSAAYADFCAAMNARIYAQRAFGK